MNAVDPFDLACECLGTSDPSAKVALTRRHAERARSGTLLWAASQANAVTHVDVGRPARPRLVDPRELPHRGLGSVEGRAALIHAVAHIEFNAINLAWDAVWRFRGMPEAYYRDWITVADDEARHFEWLCVRLAALGYAYGDFDAHSGLWEMAERTAGSCLERMALVPRVLEARGLDVTPGMIKRLRNSGDAESARILEDILREEEAHVAAGSRWFAWCCAQAKVDARDTFAALLARHLEHGLKGPFNTEARLRAGFTVDELVRMGALAA